MEIFEIIKIEQAIALKRWKLAEKLCIDYLESYPDDETVKYHLGVTLLALKKYEDSINIALFLTGKSPNNIDYRCLLADNYFHTNQYNNAQKIYQILLSESPSDDHILCQLAYCKNELFEFQEAEALAKKALTVNPNHEKAANLLILVTQLQGKSAENPLSTLLNNNPENSFGIYFKINELIKSGKIKEAYQLNEDNLALSPEDDLLQSSMKDCILNLTLVYGFIYSVGQRILNFSEKYFRKKIKYLLSSAVMAFFFWHYFAEMANVDLFIIYNVHFLMLSPLIIFELIHPAGLIYLYFHHKGYYLLDDDEKLTAGISMVLFCIGIPCLGIGLFNHHLTFCLGGYLALIAPIAFFYWSDSSQRMRSAHLQLITVILVVCIPGVFLAPSIFIFSSLLFVAYRVIFVLFFLYEKTDQKHNETPPSLNIRSGRIMHPLFGNNPISLLFEDNCIYWLWGTSNDKEELKNLAKPYFFFSKTVPYSKIQKVIFRKGWFGPKVIIRTYYKIFSFYLPDFFVIRFKEHGSTQNVFSFLEKELGIIGQSSKSDLLRPTVYSLFLYGTILKKVNEITFESIYSLMGAYLIAALIIPFVLFLYSLRKEWSFKPHPNMEDD